VADAVAAVGGGGASRIGPQEPLEADSLLNLTLLDCYFYIFIFFYFLYLSKLLLRIVSKFLLFFACILLSSHELKVVVVD
jgi:hypothetical protein